MKAFANKMAAEGKMISERLVTLKLFLVEREMVVFKDKSNLDAAVVNEYKQQKINYDKELENFKVLQRNLNFCSKC